MRRDERGTEITAPFCRLPFPAPVAPLALVVFPAPCDPTGVGVPFALAFGPVPVFFFLDEGSNARSSADDGSALRFLESVGVWMAGLMSEGGGEVRMMGVERGDMDGGRLAYVVFLLLCSS